MSMNEVTLRSWGTTRGRGGSSHVVTGVVDSLIECSRGAGLIMNDALCINPYACSGMTH